MNLHPENRPVICESTGETTPSTTRTTVGIATCTTLRMPKATGVDRMTVTRRRTAQRPSRVAAAAASRAPEVKR